MKCLDKSVEYDCIKKESIALLKPLWQKLNIHHKEKSIFFKEKYEGFTFEDRIEKLYEKAQRVDIMIEIAKLDGTIIGYGISSIKCEVGEVESIYIDPEFRGYKVGEKLMSDALDWMENKSVKIKRIVVASGNDDVLSFYKKFGFNSEYVTLRQV